MEFYSDIKKNEAVKLAGKLMELENTLWGLSRIRKTDAVSSRSHADPGLS